VEERAGIVALLRHDLEVALEVPDRGKESRNAERSEHPVPVVVLGQGLVLLHDSFQLVQLDLAEGVVLYASHAPLPTLADVPPATLFLKVVP